MIERLHLPWSRPRGERATAYLRARRPQGAAARRLAVAALLLMLSLWAFRATVFTNRVLGRGDALTYFTPYWAYRAEALRAGRLPLWNPYLFLGVPFLANPQAAVLYPLHWPLIWMRPERALVWSLVLHTWLAGCFTYALGRRWQIGRWGALTAASIYMLGGHLVGHAGQINQVNVLAWFPLAALLQDRMASSQTPYARWRGLAGLAVVIALQLLAGHTQATYISCAGLGMLVVTGALWDGLSQRCPWRQMVGALAMRLGLLALAMLLAALVAAAQLLPTLELTRLSLRAGGLGYLEAIAFSLHPRWLLLAFLPPYALQPEAALGTPIFGEYLAYASVVGLTLAGVGLLARGAGRARVLMATLAGSGVVLALGGYTPLYFILYKLIPGFNLFRVPPRWLAWYALGIALLAGMGADHLGRGEGLDLRQRLVAAWRWVRARRWRQIAGGGCLLLASVLLLFQRWPAASTVGAWLGMAGIAALLIIGARGRLAPLAAPLALAAVCIELSLAAAPLDFQHPTAPEAVTSLRTAQAHLLAAPGRFLSMSGIRFDPGDLREMRELWEGRLDAAALDDYVTAAKLKEILAPNLPLLWRLPSIDGYDGGVLPLARYSWFQTLFVTPDRLLPDGRLREQLQEIPASRVLDLAGVRYVITDKVRDVWVDGVYYDLQGRVALTPGEAFTLPEIPRFSATAMGVISYLEPPYPPDGSQVGVIEVAIDDGKPLRLEVFAGRDAAAGDAVRTGQPTTARAVFHDDLWQVDYYETRLPFGRATEARAITARSTLVAGNWVVRGVTLIDERTGQFIALPVSADGRLRRVHSGDVKIYELREGLGRAFISGRARVLADDDQAIAALADWDFDPRQEVIVSAGDPLDGAGRVGEAEIVRDEPEEVVIRARLDAPGYLVLSDANYPGWRVLVDGRPAPLLTANFLFRAVALPEGEHTVSFQYRSAALERGARVSLAGLAILGAIAAGGRWRALQNLLY